jgi:hypothetical protein
MTTKLLPKSRKILLNYTANAAMLVPAGKVQIEQVRKTERRNRAIAMLFFNFGAIWEVGGQGQAPAALPPGQRCVTHFYRRLGGTQGRSGWVRKISPTLEFDPRTVQPLAGRYTAYANRTHHVGTDTQHCSAQWCNTTSEMDFEINTI